MLSRTSFLLLLIVSTSAADEVGNRLTHLDSGCEPYWVGRDTSRLVTPQWVGEDGVEAVIVLSCDDLREPTRHEAYLRPILERLKQIDGRAPVSLMANRLPVDDPVVQRWLREGVGIEAHTTKHPCHCLQAGDLAAAKADFDRCIDDLATALPTPLVAFRMPCCDSMNSVSPRFFREIFGRTTPEGRFLSIDSSVFLLLTSADTTLDRQLVVDADGGERFGKYIPAERHFVNYVDRTFVVDSLGRDAGLRFLDLDEDDHADVVFSNGDRYSAHLFTDMRGGWSRELLSGTRGADTADGLPPIVRADGTDNGAWFKNRQMWVQNEDTGKRLPGEVDRRHFDSLLSSR